MAPSGMATVDQIADEAVRVAVDAAAKYQVLVTDEPELKDVLAKVRDLTGDRSSLRAAVSLGLHDAERELTVQRGAPAYSAPERPAWQALLDGDVDEAERLAKVLLLEADGANDAPSVDAVHNGQIIWVWLFLSDG